MTTTKTKDKIPDLTAALESANSIPDCIRKQIDILNKLNILEYNIFANKLEAYLKYITNRSSLKIQRDHFNDFYDFIDQNYPKLLFRIEGRRKSLLSTYKKLWESESDYVLKDTSGFRITLFGNENSIELLNSCYTIMQDLIAYSLKKGFIPCPADKEKDTEIFDSREYPEILIPEKSGLPQDMRQYVKDYILHLKRNGYQSLHIIFKDTDGNYFEVQIRTIYMHMIAEAGSASHANYKQKYGSLTFNRNKIKIPGYYVKNGNVFDYIGLEESLEILRRQKL